MTIGDWWGALAWVGWVLTLLLALWVVLYRLDKKLKRDQRAREGKACVQAREAMEQWRLRQAERGPTADTKTQ